MTATKDMKNQVILVNEQDIAIGTAEKLAAHEQGLLHRAFSVFIFRQYPDQAPELLLQQRALSKYHSPGLWTNTCCSHPHPGEDILDAAKRRLREELGLDLAELEPLGQFHYTAHFDNGLTENELDHVFVGWYQGEEINPDPAEIEACRWVTVDELREEMKQVPQYFTAWLGQALDLVIANL